MTYRERILSMLKSPAVTDIFQWSRPVRRMIMLICLLNLILSGSSLVITLATKGLIDGATGHDLQQVKLYAVLMAVTVILIRVCSVISGLVSTKANAVLMRDMRSMVLHRVLKKQYASVGVYHSGELVNRMFSDVNVVKSGITGIFPQLVSMAVSFFGAAFILMSMDWRFVILLVVGGLIGLAMIVGFRKPMSERHKAVQEKEGKLHSVLQETLGNLRFIKASGLEGNMEKQSDDAQADFLKVQLNRGYFSTAMNCSINTVFQLSWLICMLWGGVGIYKGALTYGSLAAIIQLVGQIQGPIAAAADIAGQAYSTVSSAERLKEVLDLPEEEDSESERATASGPELYRNLNAIILNDVSFDYGREPVLCGVNAEIKTGDFVAVTGVSGSGKSTLFQLLLGIYQPKSGSVELGFDRAGGAALAALTVDGMTAGGETMLKASKKTRPLFAYVPQGNILFSGTLRENLMMFNEGATDEELYSATKLACIDHLVEQLDDGLDTMLGERGVGLSEGQAQRVAVARAILSHAPVLLLDECTSALDEETEARLLENISRMKDRTCFIVTHRRAAVSICDYRLHIENGKLVKMEC